MERRDMERSAWTRVFSKKQIIRDFTLGQRRGKISLMKILQIRAPLVRSDGERDVVLADEGYYWLQLALHGSHAWFTAMFDARGEFIQIYVDVTDGNEALSENPSFEDMYLDFVVSGDKVFELDRDELEEAFCSGRISAEQYATALSEGKRIRDELLGHREEIRAFFCSQFEKLKNEPDLS